MAITEGPMVSKPKRKPTGAAALGAGPGRPKGVPNKMTREVKAMILQALDKAGGVAYLTRCARDPRLASAFLSLVGKVLPLQVTGGDGRTLAQELASMPKDVTDA